MTERLDSPVSRQLDALAVNYDWVEIPLDPDKKPVRSLEELLIQTKSCAVCCFGPVPTVLCCWRWPAAVGPIGECCANILMSAA